jgi:hypothetical protein
MTMKYIKVEPGTIKRTSANVPQSWAFRVYNLFLRIEAWPCFELLCIRGVFINYWLKTQRIGLL